MRRLLLGCVAIGTFLLPVHFAAAQSPIDALEQELKEAKQQHQDITTQVMSNFFQQVDAGMGSPDAALALYQQANGPMPTPALSVSTHANETPTERDARLAIDQANLTKLGLVLQLHCGLMHFGAMFILKPNEPGLQQKWVEWLKTAAQIYPQIGSGSSTDDDTPQQTTPHHHRKRDDADNNGGGNGGGSGGGYSGQSGAGLMGMDYKTSHDSMISHFLTFKSWGDKEQGQWMVHMLPQLYRVNVMDPLRATPTEATLAAWDVYITMLSSDEKDNERWNNVTYPPLQFARGCDAYTVSPNTEKLEDLVNLIKANPTGSKVDDWIAQVHKLMDDYRSRHGGVASAAPDPSTTGATPAPPADPSKTVVTEQQGDMTVITTKPVTNGPAATPPPAPPPAQ